MNRVYELLNRFVSKRDYCVVHRDDLGLVAGRQYLRKLFGHFAFDYVFDVGANKGQYAQLLRRDVGYGGPILSVEPLPAIAEELRRKARGDANWAIYEGALDSTPGTAPFHVMVGHEFSSLIPPAEQFDGKFHGQQRVKETIEVKIETLDTLFRKHEAEAGFKTPFVKLDTQGTELRVLDGAAYALQKIPAVQLEVGFQVIYEGAPDIRETIGAMADLGFSLSGLFANNRGHFPQLVEMDAVFVKSSLLGDLA